MHRVAKKPFKFLSEYHLQQWLITSPDGREMLERLHQRQKMSAEISYEKRLLSTEASLNARQAQLEARAAELDEREAAIAARERRAAENLAVVHHDRVELYSRLPMRVGEVVMPVTLPANEILAEEYVEARMTPHQRSLYEPGNLRAVFAPRRVTTAELAFWSAYEDSCRIADQAAETQKSRRPAADN